MNRKAYIVFNIVFLVLISGIFFYCYSVNSLQEHISCVHQKYLGIDCPSCGLTRSFSSILHQNTQEALEWNRYGFQIFLFFLIQLGFRIVFPLLVIMGSSLKVIIKIDWIMSAVLFLVCFYPFIFSTFYLFYKMLVTGNVNL